MRASGSTAHRPLPRLRDSVEAARGTLEAEDATMFRRRLLRLEPVEVPAFTAKQRAGLADLVRATHKSVRGPIDLGNWEATVRQAVKSSESPRAVIRALIDELESAWWAGG